MTPQEYALVQRTAQDLTLGIARLSDGLAAINASLNRLAAQAEEANRIALEEKFE